MKDRSSKPALLSKYLEMYEKNPDSKVFAPLAEAYRSLGMHDSAFDILKKGITKHPNYTMGIIVLGECYYDKKEFKRCYKAISGLIKNNIDNILLQNLYAKCCEQLGYLEESLDSYRYLLFLNPKDKNAYSKIKELEKDLSYSRNLFVHEAPKKQINVTDYFEDSDNWVQVNFDKKSLLENSNDDWEVAESPEDLPPVIKNYEKPIVSHTLVDLYLSQGHKEKAIEILESIIDLHPSDDRSIMRLRELKSYSGEILPQKRELKFNNPLRRDEDELPPVIKSNPTPVNSEESEHEILLNLIEEKVNKVETSKNYNDKLNYKKIKGVYNLFLDRLNETARDKRGHLGNSNN